MSVSPIIESNSITATIIHGHLCRGSCHHRRNLPATGGQSAPDRAIGSNEHTARCAVGAIQGGDLSVVLQQDVLQSIPRSGLEIGLARSPADQRNGHLLREVTLPPANLRQ
jgi:hypothetical protein